MLLPVSPFVTSDPRDMPCFYERRKICLIFQLNYTAAGLNIFSHIQNCSTFRASLSRKTSSLSASRSSWIMSEYSFCLSKAYTRPAAVSEQEKKKRKQGEVGKRNTKNTEVKVSYIRAYKRRIRHRILIGQNALINFSIRAWF